MEAYIKAISYYLPEMVVTNEELVKEFPEWSVEKIAKKVGINERHIAATQTSKNKSLNAPPIDVHQLSPAILISVKMIAKYLPTVFRQKLPSFRIVEQG